MDKPLQLKEQQHNRLVTLIAIGTGTETVPSKYVELGHCQTEHYCFYLWTILPGEPKQFYDRETIINITMAIIRWIFENTVTSVGFWGVNLCIAITIYQNPNNSNKLENQTSFECFCLTCPLRNIQQYAVGMWIDSRYVPK